MRTLVVDASVAIKFVIIEKGTPEARDLLPQAYAGDIELVAPSLVRLEVANALWKGLRRGHLAAAEVQSMLEEFLLLPLSIQDSPELLRPALALACTAGCTVYDATYTALALILGCRLVTADRQQFEVAEKALALSPGQNVLVPS